jgi:hypothetical protein
MKELRYLPSDKRIFTLRLTDEDYEKIKAISAFNNRSMANQIEHLIRIFISEHEKKNGPVEVDI